jgi:hypothetical protein
VVLFFAGSFAVSYYRRKKAKDEIVKKMTKRTPGRLQLFGTILLFLLLVREAGIPFLSMRIWMILFAIIFIWWALKFTLSFKKNYRFRLNQKVKHAKKLKYMPKKR